MGGSSHRCPATSAYGHVLFSYPVAALGSRYQRSIPPNLLGSATSFVSVTYLDSFLPLDDPRQAQQLVFKNGDHRSTNPLTATG